MRAVPAAAAQDPPGALPVLRGGSTRPHSSGKCPKFPFNQMFPTQRKAAAAGAVSPVPTLSQGPVCHCPWNSCVRDLLVSATSVDPLELRGDKSPAERRARMASLPGRDSDTVGMAQ